MSPAMEATVILSRCHPEPLSSKQSGGPGAPAVNALIAVACEKPGWGCIQVGEHASPSDTWVPITSHRSGATGLTSAEAL